MTTASLPRSIASPRLRRVRDDLQEAPAGPAALGVDVVLELAQARTSSAIVALSSQECDRSGSTRQSSSSSTVWATTSRSPAFHARSSQTQ
jgi:hypothetical protein